MPVEYQLCCMLSSGYFYQGPCSPHKNSKIIILFEHRAWWSGYDCTLWSVSAGFKSYLHHVIPHLCNGNNSIYCGIVLW